jgi:hypothetical protein
MWSALSSTTILYGTRTEGFPLAKSATGPHIFCTSICSQSICRKSRN